jgi:hypothetical protein
VVVALRRRGAPEFTDEQLAMTAAFTDQATVAWQLANTQRRMRELDVVSDRERIARDLHDHVIQRLFAVGLSLQGAIPRARSAEVQQRLSDIVADLDRPLGAVRDQIADPGWHGALEAQMGIAGAAIIATRRSSRSPMSGLSASRSSSMPRIASTSSGSISGRAWAKRAGRPNSSKSFDWRFTPGTTRRNRSGRVPWGC